MASENGAYDALSPLDQIRQVEADIVRQVAAAREAADEKIKHAQNQVKEILVQARESGRNQGASRYKTIVSNAEEEAHAIVSQAHNKANRLRHKGKQRMSAAVRQAVNLIVYVEDDGEDQ